MYAVFKDWGGKTTATLRAVADQLSPSDYDMLLTACRSHDETSARAASWVLKAAYERGHDVPFPDDLLARDLHWEIALHLLQSVRLTVVSIAPALIAPYLSHKKPMVRAWALDAYIHIGAPDAEAAVKLGLIDPAASVRARARHAKK